MAVHDSTLHETDRLPCPGCGHGSYHPEAVEHGGVGSWCTRCESYVDVLARESARADTGNRPEAARATAEAVETVTLVLPWSVLASSNLRHQGPGRSHARGYREARDNAATLVSASYSGAPIDRPVKVSATFHPPDRRRRDCPNLEKALHDSLELGGVLADDWQIRAWEGCVGDVDKDDARVEVSVVVLDVERVRAEEEAA